MPSPIAIRPVQIPERYSSPGRGSPERAEVLDSATIAEISSSDIERMTSEELARVVWAADLPHLPPVVESRLDYRDRPTLEKLAHQARLCCRYDEEAHHG
jgi:hypothetical protein